MWSASVVSRCVPSHTSVDPLVLSASINMILFVSQLESHILNSLHYQTKRPVPVTPGQIGMDILPLLTAHSGVTVKVADLGVGTKHALNNGCRERVRKDIFEHKVGADGWNLGEVARRASGCVSEISSNGVGGVLPSVYLLEVRGWAVDEVLCLLDHAPVQCVYVG